MGVFVLKDEMRKCMKILDDNLQKIFKKSDDQFERIDKKIDRKTKIVLFRLGDAL